MQADRRCSQEELLLDYVKQLSAHRKGRHAVHLTLCRLTRMSRHPMNLQRAARIMRSLFDKGEGKLFPLKNNDIIVVVSGVSPAEIERPIMRIRMLMREDANLAEAEEEDRDILAIRYDLTRDYDRFADAMKVMVSDIHADCADGADDKPTLSSEPEVRPEKVDLESLAGPVEPAAVPKGQARAVRLVRDDGSQRPPFSLTDLARLETALQSIDLEPFLTQVPIMLIESKDKSRRILHERQVSLRRLLERFLPRTAPDLDPWMAIKARQLASHRHLQTLEVPNLGDDLAVLVGANLSGIFNGPLLAKVAKTMPTPLRARVALAIRMEEVQTDPARYLAARSRLASAGFLTAITHASLLSFAITDWALLPADFVSMRYSRRLESDLSDDERQGFERAMRTIGPARAILTDCLLPQAITKGRDLGFRLFQGPAASAYLSAR